MGTLFHAPLQDLAAFLGKGLSRCLAPNPYVCSPKPACQSNPSLPQTRFRGPGQIACHIPPLVSVPPPLAWSPAWGRGSGCARSPVLGVLELPWPQDVRMKPGPLPCCAHSLSSLAAPRGLVSGQYLGESLVPDQASTDCQGTAGRTGMPVRATNPPWSPARANVPGGDSPSAPPGMCPQGDKGTPAGMLRDAALTVRDACSSRCLGTGPGGRGRMPARPRPHSTPQHPCPNPKPLLSDRVGTGGDTLWAAAARAG